MTGGRAFALKAVAGGLCAYELAALATGKVPTLTRLCGEHDWLGPVLVAALAFHLGRQRRECVHRLG